MFRAIDLTAISRKPYKVSILDMNLKMIKLKLHPHVPETNEFKHVLVGPAALGPVSTKRDLHYSDVIMNAIACQITSLRIVNPTAYTGADQRTHQSSASLAFVGFPTQRANNAENVSIWWRHHLSRYGSRRSEHPGQLTSNSSMFQIGPPSRARAHCHGFINLFNQRTSMGFAS